MPGNTEPLAIIPFGPFEAYLTTQELRKQGIRLRLPRQSFQILQVLLERPGKLVTRDEIRQTLWPSDTFVDFDHGVNAAINRLREALGDNADDPRYIETLPRRGYRFVGPIVLPEPPSVPEAKVVVETPPKDPAEVPIGLPVEVVAEGSAGSPVHALQEGEQGKQQGTIEPEPAVTLTPTDALPALEEHTATTNQARPLRSGVYSAILPMVIIAVTILAGALYWQLHRVKKLTNKEPIVLGNFANKTSDPVFDDTLKQALSVSLGQSSSLNILSEQRVRSTLKLMGRSESDPLLPDAALEVCKRTGSTAVLSGSIASLGSQYVLGLNATECSTGEILAQAQVQAARKEDVLKALDKASTQLRGKLGESLTTMQHDDTPLEQATTASLEALQAYSQGRKLHVSGNDAAAVAFDKQAVALDPNFAIAYLDLHFASGDWQALEKAFALRDHTSERERYRIEAYYYAETADFDDARATSSRWAKAYPQDFGSFLALGFVGQQDGDFNQGINDMREALRLAPESGLVLGSLASLYMSANHLEEATSTMARLPAGPDPTRYALAFLAGDTQGMKQQLTEAAGKSYLEGKLHAMAGDTAAYYGHNSEARELTRRAVSAAKRDGNKENAAWWQATMALREAELGNRKEARQQAQAAIALASTRDSQIYAALTLARNGDLANVAKSADGLAERYPHDTQLSHYWLPCIRAAIALQQKNPKQALEALEIAGPYELGNEGPLYPVYLRGEAFLQLHKGKEAAAEFQKILVHRGVVLNNIIGALAHLGMARAAEIQGDTADSLQAYKDFFTLWKDADPDIPVLKQCQSGISSRAV